MSGRLHGRPIDSAPSDPPRCVVSNTAGTKNESTMQQCIISDLSSADGAHSAYQIQPPVPTDFPLLQCAPMEATAVLQSISGGIPLGCGRKARCSCARMVCTCDYLVSPTSPLSQHAPCPRHSNTDNRMKLETGISEHSHEIFELSSAAAARTLIGTVQFFCLQAAPVCFMSSHQS